MTLSENRLEAFMLMNCEAHNRKLVRIIEIDFIYGLDLRSMKLLI